MKKGSKNIRLGTTRTNKNKSWTFVTNVSVLKATLFATDGKTTGAKLIIKVLLKKGAPDLTTRGC